MDKAHVVEKVGMTGTTLTLVVDNKQYRVDLAAQSERIARATQRQRDNFEVSASGYGIHWPDIDEDLSIDGLIGVKHVEPTLADAAVARDRPARARRVR